MASVRTIFRDYLSLRSTSRPNTTPLPLLSTHNATSPRCHLVRLSGAVDELEQRKDLRCDFDSFTFECLNFGFYPCDFCPVCRITDVEDTPVCNSPISCNSPAKRRPISPATGHSPQQQHRSEYVV